MRTWPLPALLTWAAAWALALALRAAQAPLWASLALPTALGACATWLPFVANTTWRRVFVAAGFPLSVIALGQGAALPGWLWLAPLALLLLAYPVHAWRDAPVFPTPRGALRDLPSLAPLNVSSSTDPEAGQPPRILDAGCGMGDALAELHAAYPQAQVHGIEWSWMWRFVAALRCPWAQVTRGDMWAQSWADFELVYLFQRPETMPRAWDKALREMRPGTWLVSLEFAASDKQGAPVKPQACLQIGGGRPIWVYRIVSHDAGRPTTL
ncbi:MAG: class I SAM-dependent methyltransferase [Burkholderiales bacterium]|jgi:hypothetical protein|nr:MAG: class I SAM-dependent methyltransferase [Burkholderiales bacterium]